jgi:hypothetical protein
MRWKGLAIADYCGHDEYGDPLEIIAGVTCVDPSWSTLRRKPGIAISDRGTANYDAVNERLTKNQPAPEGLLIHFAGFDDEDGVFRIVNVWETREQGQAYLEACDAGRPRRAR